MKAQEVTIFVSLWNNGKGLKKTLDSIYEQGYEGVNVFVAGHLKVAVEKKIKKAYSEVVIQQTTEIISAVFNQHLVEVDTEFIMFMNEFDVLKEGFIKHSVNALNQHTENSIAAGKSHCIYPLLGKTSQLHIFSRYKNESTERIDLLSTPEKLIANLEGCVLRSSFAKQQTFCEDVKYEANIDYILNLLVKEPSYIAVPEAQYHFYRPRENHFLYYEPSHYKEWYTDSLQKFLMPLLQKSQEQYGQVPVFLQIYAMYNTRSRMLTNRDNRDKKVLLGDDLTDYLQVLGHMLQMIEDKYVLNCQSLSCLIQNPELKCMYLRIKYNTDTISYQHQCFDSEKGRDLAILYDDNLISVLSDHDFTINMMNYFSNEVWIDGTLINIFEHSDVEFYAKFNGKKYPITDTKTYSITKYFGSPAYRRFTFCLQFPLDRQKQKQNIAFFAKINNEEFQLSISFSNHWAKLTKALRYSYWRFNDYICYRNDNNIVIKKATKTFLLKREIKLLQSFIKRGKEKDYAALRFRLIYWLTRPYFKRKKIWLLLDKLYKGGDSAEYLYRYSGKLKDGVSKYYLIDEKTPEFEKLKRDGYKPLKTGTLKHKLVFVNADILMITNSHLFPFNGFTKSTSKYIRGLCNFSSMCLQHGLSVQKCAIAQRRIIDNTMMYFLASEYEVKNLSKRPYGYAGFDILKTTGIGRYDGLINNDKKQILLSPTWRMYNALPVTTSEGEQRGYNPRFKETTYFHVYNNLINNERLIAAAREYGYKIKFLLHPILSSQIDDFTPNEDLEVIPSVGDLNYEKILTESSLMVTDYSGVQFDFAYMRKPIVYFHPDVLPPHYEDGIFFYDTMGFGEICTKSEQLVETLCDYMKNECKMKEMYVKRADDFFVYDDHNNCKRIYDEVMKFQKKIDVDKNRK